MMMFLSFVLLVANLSHDPDVNMIINLIYIYRSLAYNESERAKL
jgi:hypothetical protein